MAFIALSHSAFSQTEETSISAQFDEVMKNSETFKQYKVVPITRLRTLFSAVKDSLDVPKIRINNLKAKVDNQENQIVDLTERTEVLEADLETSNGFNNDISFLGMTFEKTVYNLIVWGIIIALTAVIGVIYLMYQRSNKITQNAKKELSSIVNEFDEHKTKSHEKQVKLKRDLQTAWNALNENGIQV